MSIVIPTDMSPPQQQRPNNNPGGGGGGNAGRPATASSARTPNAAPPSSGPMKMIGASSADACATIVNSLMHHSKHISDELKTKNTATQGGETESFSRSAIQSLVKKLKEKRDELDALITAVTSNGVSPSACVTIPKTLDGRLQVASRKGFPHVIYARIWRWPDLHKNELKQVDFCQNGYDMKDRDVVCVNPYHYNRVIGPGLDLSGLTLGALGHGPGTWGSFADQQLSRTNAWVNGNGNVPPAYPGFGNPRMPNGHTNGRGRGHAINGNIPPRPHHHPPPPPHPQHMMNHNGRGMPPNGGTNGGGTNGGGPPGGEPSNGQQSFQRGGTVNYTQANNGKNGNHPQQQQPNAAQWHTPLATNNGGPGPSNGTGGPPAPHPHHNHQQQHRSIGGGNNGSIPMSNGSSAHVHPISRQPMPEYWCSIAYYELDSQVGETFKVPASSRSVVVDGYFRPLDATGGKRFCLGALTNVHRSQDSEKTRKYIGPGVMLDIDGEGDCWLKCQSSYAVFIQSYFLDKEAGRTPGDAVHKIHPEAYTKVFDLRQCFQQMQMNISNATAAAAAQAAAVSGHQQDEIIPQDINISSSGGVSVDDMRRQCIVRVAFVKGWGHDYEKRPTIKQTPCWIEIHLHRALQLCDEVLHTVPERQRKTMPNISD